MPAQSVDKPGNSGKREGRVCAAAPQGVPEPTARRAALGRRLNPGRVSCVIPINRFSELLKF